MFIKQFIMVVISCALVACAGSETAPGDEQSEVRSGRADCICRSSIRGYSVLDESNLIVEGSGRRKYHVVLQRRAYGLSSTWGITFDSPTGRV